MSLKRVIVRRIVACVVLGVAMLSCRTSHQRIVEERQRFAVERVCALPAQVNAADCTPILQYVDPSQAKQVWTSGCEAIGKKFGKWKALSEVSTFEARGSPDYLIVQGRASFTAGEFHMEAHWNTAVDPPHLFFLDFSAADGERFSIPALKAQGPRDLPSPGRGL